MTSPRRTLLITGATGALGQAVVEALAPQASLVLVARHAPPTVAGGLSLAADVLSDDAMAGVAREVAHRFGGVDGFVHVAGGFEMGEPVHALTRAAWDRMMDVNAWSFVTTARHVVPLMRGRAGAAIVAVSAAAAAHGEALKGGYAASKAALQRLVESMAAELAPDGIRVNSVAPTVLDTPANRAAMPGADAGGWTPLPAAAEAVIFLVSDAGRGVTGRHLVLG